MAIIASLAASFSLNTAKFRDELKKSRSSLRKFERRVKNTFRSLKNSITSSLKSIFSMKGAITALAGSAGIGLLVKSSLNAIDNIGKMSRLYRISTEDLGAFSLAAKIGGIELDMMLKAARNTSRQMFDFSNGVGEAKDAMERMGITQADIVPLMNDQVALMGFLAEKINQVEDSTSRLAIAQDIFGGRAITVLNALKDGRDGMEAFRKEAKLLGIALSSEAVAGVEEANDSIARLGFLFKGLRDQTVAALAPAISQLVTNFKNFILEAANARGGIKNLARDMAVSIVEGIKTAISAIESFIGGLKEVKKFLQEVGFLQDKEIVKLKEQRAAAFQLFRQRRMSADQLDRVRNMIDAQIQSIENSKAAQEGEITVFERARASLDGLTESIIKNKNAKASIVPDNNSQTVPTPTQDIELNVVSGFDPIKASQEERDARLEQLREEQFNRFEILRAARENEVKLEQDVNNKIISMRQNTFSLLAGFLQQFAGKSKAAAIAVIAINKALSIAQAIQNTAVAVTKALTVDPTGALAARVATLGKIQIGLIAATGLAQAASLGGGGASAGSPANPVYTQPSEQYQSSQQHQAQATSQTFIIVGNSQFTDADIDGLIGEIYDRVNNSGQVIIRRDSNQARELADVVAG